MSNKEYATCGYCGHSEMCNIQYSEDLDEDGNAIQEKSHVCKDCFDETFR
jgi:hypothetical protein